MPNWTDLRYLLHGNRRQQRAHSLLQTLEIWPILTDFKPVLAGTIPLGIDIAGSDLDVLCEVQPTKAHRFIKLLEKHYGRRTGFQLIQTIIGSQASIVSSFRYRGRAVEIFAQALPTAQQNGFRHLLVEAAVLEAGGPAWRRAVRQLKQQGLKTEPAFAKLLRLAGNPYVALLELEGQSTAELQAYMTRHSIFRK